MALRQGLHFLNPIRCLKKSGEGVMKGFCAFEEGSGDG